MNRRKVKAKFQCSVCLSPFVGAVTTMATMGADAVVIAQECGFDVTAVEAHLAKCDPSAPDESGSGDDAPSEMSDAKLRALITDSERISKQAEATGSLVAASSANSVRLRALQEQGRRAEARTAAKIDQELSMNLDDWSEQECSRMRRYLDRIGEETDRNLSAINEVRDRKAVNDSIEMCRAHKWRLASATVATCKARGWNIPADVDPSINLEIVGEKPDVPQS